jgi:hypothetical protein
MADSPEATRIGTVKLRTTSKVVATKVGCIPLRDAYAKAVDAGPKTWESVEDLFLRGMEGFDENVANGIADMGDLQNGKGDFFNDLLALILENCSGTKLYSRGDVPGLIFPKHHLDVSYPAIGATQFTLEAKAVGTPRHPGSPKENAIGRPGAADLDKRVKEIAFKTIDLKAEYARILASRGESPNVISGDLTNWIRTVKPRSFVFFSARVVGDKDRDRVVRFADLASLVSDAVGAFCFTPVSASQPTRYRTTTVPAHIAMARVLFRACQDLKALRDAEPLIPSTPSPSIVAEKRPDG